MFTCLRAKFVDMSITVPEIMGCFDPSDTTEPVYGSLELRTTHRKRFVAYLVTKCPGDRTCHFEIMTIQLAYLRPENCIAGLGRLNPINKEQQQQTGTLL